ncbi:hypothetical protein SODALDRAFT_320450 [Sodiomyces alkalinus F11]|uniref:DUF7582 domain-containing protein n=1 Tax=Sodiomyces alkalinus (strain CBS 110278 / VKM F-3762 / F11) TaxID=1314773 RepID=A0A3N2PN67_SODAK|nr:hypothetical protein SODALDRAFT_320450 [Sodiomyces alkalinus F11]ROT35981.1 hypothetical protein SODALDRAFT_320450 [Sodiomyces alkalinus F11]
MSLSKRRISSPLEAGPSILDAQNLCPQLNDVLEYAAGRLARKGVDLTLVVLSREYQLPSIPLSPCTSPGVVSPPSSPGIQGTATTGTACSSPSSTSTSTTTTTTTIPSTPSPSRLAFAARPVASIKKKLIRPGRLPLPSLASAARGTEKTNLPSSPARSRRWPQSPASSVSTPPPITPCSPFSVSSTAATAETSVPATPACISGVAGPGSFVVRLVHPDVVTPRHERILRQAIDRAGKKFGIGPDRLPQMARASTFGLTAALTHRSLAQNEVVFSAEGLTLVSLDRLYTFKAALASYSRTGWPPRLEDAVDELRRLVLVRRRATSRAELLRSYDGLRVSAHALAEVDRMYRRAYGGPEQTGAVDGVGTPERTKHEEAEDDDEGEKWRRTTDEDTGRDKEEQAASRSAWEDSESDFQEEADLPIVMLGPARKSSTPSLRKTPVLKLKTQFDATPPPSPAQKAHGPLHNAQPVRPENTGEDSAMPTAKPGRGSRQVAIWSPISIAEVLGDDGRSTAQREGPMTPNGYDDISPITRGEWGFLMGGATGGVHHIRTAAVVRC